MNLLSDVFIASLIDVSASLPDSKFIVIYTKQGTWPRLGKLRVGDVINDSVAYGPEVTFFTQSSGNTLGIVEIRRLSSTEFLIAYNDTYAVHMDSSMFII